MKRLLLGSLLALATAARSQDLGGFEKILLPVYSSSLVRGANGTLFQTRLIASAKTPVNFYPAAGGSHASIGAQPAGTGVVDLFEAAQPSAGRLMYVDRPSTGQIDFFYHLTVTGSDSVIHRATLPVVREARFHSGKTSILGLSTGPKFVDPENPIDVPVHIGFNRRNHVRIYDVDHAGNLSVKVRVTIAALRAYGPFAELDVRLGSRDGDDPSYPFYAVVALPDLCITAPHGARCRDYDFEVTIEPSDANARYFAFASSTDNASGETSIFFAQ